jgi:hypothetical protein
MLTSQHQQELRNTKRRSASQIEIEKLKIEHRDAVLWAYKVRRIQNAAEISWLIAYDDLCSSERCGDYSPI